MIVLIGCSAIHSLGEHLTYHLVKPILQRCSVEQLHRFEQSSPVSSFEIQVHIHTLIPIPRQHLQQATPGLSK
jgi:hypothetical protein